MSNLRIVIDQLIAPDPGEEGRYARALTKALITTAPQGVGVEGFVSASPAADYERIERELPGLARLEKSPLDRRTLQSIWRRGLGARGPGMLHAPGLFAPLQRHDRTGAPGQQTVVTIHDTLAWTSPDGLPRGEAAWRRAMVRRAEKHADAVIVPNHSVAEVLDEHARFGDRVRVIAGGASTNDVPTDGEDRPSRLGLPDEYLLASGEGLQRPALRTLMRGMSRTDGPGIPLVVLGPAEAVVDAEEAGLDPARIICLPGLEAADSATVMRGAQIFVHPGPTSGFGLSVLDAMQVGTPVVHADDPALEELTSDAALVVSRNDVSGYTASLAQHLAALLEDRQTRERMSVAGRDRARLYDWRDVAEKVWQLHADL